MTETEALQALQQGSEGALEWFINKYTPYVSTIVYHIIGGAMGPPDVEEVAADVFFALWNNAGKVRVDSIRGYLGSIARNKAKNKLRESGQDLSLEEDILVIEGDTAEERLEEQELRERVRCAVLSMEEPDRDIFLRHYYHCQPLAGIAEELGMKLSTVKTRLHRGREKLRTALTGDTMKEETR